MSLENKPVAAAEEPLQRQRFGLVRWFQPETLIGRVRQERAMRTGQLRGLPTAFGQLDTKAGDL
jgi:hypothetical protein